MVPLTHVRRSHSAESFSPGLAGSNPLADRKIGRDLWYPMARQVIRSWRCFRREPFSAGYLGTSSDAKPHSRPVLPYGMGSDAVLDEEAYFSSRTAKAQSSQSSGGPYDSALGTLGTHRELQGARKTTAFAISYCALFAQKAAIQSWAGPSGQECSRE